MGFELPKVDPAKHAFSLFDEFKNFAFKGNVVDLAVGVIIGGAFGKIVDALVKSVIMPGFAALSGGKAEEATEWAKKLVYVAPNKVEIPYGVFVGELLSFLIMAFVLFIFVVKLLGWVMRTRKADAAAPPPPPADVVLLMEIRDLLKAQTPRA